MGVFEAPTARVSLDGKRVLTGSLPNRALKLAQKAGKLGLIVGLLLDVLGNSAMAGDPGEISLGELFGSLQRWGIAIDDDDETTDPLPCDWWKD